MDYPRVAWDRETNTAYIYFGEIGAEQAVLQLPVMLREEDPVAVLDFSADGELLGVELLNAEAQLPRIFRDRNQDQDQGPDPGSDSVRDQE